MGEIKNETKSAHVNEWKTLENEMPWLDVAL